ncbi:Os09g0425800 [Oryza sativa Japonica Group]|uniref:Os09g0425800 protein n=1 Tax=Oryza sativa subsp. japonica TaxID=39947 RepID=A0A0P0XNL0_ORYSJ|nr:hypothetical protein EE612_047936 [Oryza sativa]BAT08168.1 Os09g0425800 [Oryza sativa Japonica Group]
MLAGTPKMKATRFLDSLARTPMCQARKKEGGVERPAEEGDHLLIVSADVVPAACSARHQAASSWVGELAVDISSCKHTQRNTQGGSILIAMQKQPLMHASYLAG